MTPGWRSKPGEYAIPPSLPGAPATEMTILPDGARTTGPRGTDGPSVVFVGCSFTQGIGISDADTYAGSFRGASVIWAPAHTEPTKPS